MLWRHGPVNASRPQDHPNEDGLPDWLDPIYDEDDPREYMQVPLLSIS
jgi:hypothetical protein